MTITPQDLVDLPWDEAFARAGAAYARHVLLAGRHHGLRRRPARQLALHTAAELAFRRWMEAEALPFNLVRDSPLTDPVHYVPSVGGRWIRIQALWSDQPRRAARAQADTAWLISQWAPVPDEWLSAPSLEQGDLLALVLLTPQRPRTPPVIEAEIRGLPHLVALPPAHFTRGSASRDRPRWLAAINRADHPIELELAGRLPRGRQVMQTLHLPPGKWIVSRVEWAALCCVSVHARPARAVVLSDRGQGRPWRIDPRTWQDVWLTEQRVMLVGWATLGEVRGASRRGSAMPTGERFRQSREMHLLPLSALRPMRALAARLRAG